MENEFERAKALYEKGEWVKSLGILKEVPDRKARALEAWNNWKLDEVVEALKICNRIINNERLDEVNSSLLSLRALIAKKMNEPREIVLGYLDECLRALPLEKIGSREHAMRINTAFIISAQLKDYDRAHRYFDEVAVINLRNGDTHQIAKNLYNLASLVFRPQQRYEEMRKVLQLSMSLYEIVGAESDMAATWYQVGWSWEEQGEFFNALSCYAENRGIWQKLKIPKRIEQAEINYQRVKEKMKNLA